MYSEKVTIGISCNKYDKTLNSEKSDKKEKDSLYHC